MATSLVHIGDFHAASGPRNADRYRALDQIIREGLALEHLGAWLWPGDLFDSLSNADDRNALDARIQQMADAAPVVIVYGNHDRPGDLDGFARLKATHPIFVVDRPRVQLVPLATGEMAAIFCLPYPQKAVLVGAGVAAGEVVSTAGDILEPVFMNAAAQLEDCRAAGYLTLMIGHVNVAGAQLSNGQPNIGHEIELNPAHLERLGDIPKLLNHVHKPQTIAGARYAGSVCRFDYGEIEEKRYLVVELQHDGPSQEYRIGSRRIDVAPMFHITGDLDRDGFISDPIDGVDYSTGAIDWAGCDIRVRYRYRASEKAVIKEQTIRDLFGDALRLKLEGVAIPDRALRAPEVAAAKTLPEKLAAFRKVPQLEPTVADKLQQLHQADTEGFLAHVAAQLAAIEMPERAQVAA